MFGLNESLNYYLYPGYITMNKGIEMLYQLVSADNLDVLSGDVYLFISKRRDTIKILRWEKDGFMLYQKRLERGTFEIPRFKPREGWLELDWKLFILIMAGVSIRSVKFNRRLCI